MTGPELNNKIEVGNTLEETEKNLIAGLNLNAFDKPKEQENKNALRELIKNTAIKTIDLDENGKPKSKTLLEIADDFTTYVEKWDGWKLTAKQKNTNGETLVTPEYIKYIIANPKDNDLAYFIQKISTLVNYKTARLYKNDDIDAKEVKEDKMFGNQTKRALDWLKTWITNTASTEVNDWKKYEWKYISEDFLLWLISGKTDDTQKNSVLEKYNLQYKENKISPLDTYEFIDPNSNNYAVEKSPGNQGTETPGTEWKVETNENTTWDAAAIKEQLKWQWLDNDEDLINQITSKNYTYDSLEYNNMYITINKWIIAIYLDNKDFEAADKLGRNEKNKEDTNRWNTLRENKIKELLVSIDDTTITDSNKKIALKSVPWVFFKNTQELKSFIRWRNALIEKFAYASFMAEPFNISEKWNIYHEDKNGEKKYLEDYIWTKYADIKYIEDYKWDSEDYKAEVKKIVAYLNNMKCRDSKISIEWMTRPY